MANVRTGAVPIRDRNQGSLPYGEVKVASPSLVLREHSSPYSIDSLGGLVAGEDLSHRSRGVSSSRLPNRVCVRVGAVHSGLALVGSSVVPTTRRTLLLDAGPRGFRDPTQSVLLGVSTGFRSSHYPDRVIVNPQSLQRQVVVHHGHRSLVFLVHAFSPHRCVAKSTHHRVLFRGRTRLEHALHRRLRYVLVVGVHPQGPTAVFFLRLIGVLYELQRSFCRFYYVPQGSRQRTTLAKGPIRSFVRQEALRASGAGDSNTRRSLVRVAARPTVRRGSLALHP